MIRIEIDAENVVELKEQLKGLLNEPVKSIVTVTAPKIEDIKKLNAPAEGAKTTDIPKEESKPAATEKEPVKAEELTEDQKTELRSLCADYVHKVADGKERIKQFLKDKGLAKVTELKPTDLPEFKAMVQI